MKDLNKILKDLGITQQEVANELKIKSLGTANLKINRKAEFTYKEANLLKKLINSRTEKKYSLEDLFDDTAISSSSNDC